MEIGLKLRSRIRQIGWVCGLTALAAGWDVTKQEIAMHASDYTREKCAWVSVEWRKMVKRMTPS